MKARGCPETSATTCHSTRRNIPENVNLQKNQFFKKKKNLLDELHNYQLLKMKVSYTGWIPVHCFKFSIVIWRENFEPFYPKSSLHQQGKSVGTFQYQFLDPM